MGVSVTDDNSSSTPDDIVEYGPSAGAGSVARSDGQARERCERINRHSLPLDSTDGRKFVWM